ncbi:hypothetical protein V6N13_016891 [Hibiscus sabdariffa]|uniref:Secreted protein n=1 Tax=Hibiscus sabdariffa TaxID=183260 RepID=A0ABR2PUG4_9ROSI
MPCRFSLTIHVLLLPLPLRSLVLCHLSSADLRSDVVQFDELMFCIITGGSLLDFNTCGSLDHSPFVVASPVTNPPPVSP